MVILVFGLDIIQDLDGIIHTGRIDHHFLETTVKGTVFLNVHPVFIQGGSTNTLEFATGQGRFKDIAGIQ